MCRRVFLHPVWVDCQASLAPALLLLLLRGGGGEEGRNTPCMWLEAECQPRMLFKKNTSVCIVCVCVSERVIDDSFLCFRVLGGIKDSQGEPH